MKPESGIHSKSTMTPLMAPVGGQRGTGMDPQVVSSNEATRDAVGIPILQTVNTNAGLSAKRQDMQD